MLTARMYVLLFIATFLLVVDQVSCAPLEETNDAPVVKREAVEQPKPDVVIKVLKKKEAPTEKEASPDADETINREKRRSNKKSKSHRNG